MTADHTNTTPNATTVRNGALIGMAASAAMAMYAMMASATYQHHGFFTRLFHLSALVGSPKSMMQSMTAAIHGDTFWFTPGAALSGLIVHMATGPMYGVGFALLVRRVGGAALVAAGMAYGLAALVFSGLIALPLAASIAGAGTPISDMADTVGWGTFAVEHLIFGIALGVGLLALDGSRRATPPGGPLSRRERPNPSPLDATVIWTSTGRRSSLLTPARPD